MTVRPGIYKHYKGGIYRVLMTGHLSEQRDQEMVIYVGLTRGPHGIGNVWIRPIEMFLELVDWPDGTKRPRFEWDEEQEASP